MSDKPTFMVTSRDVEGILVKMRRFVEDARKLHAVSLLSCAMKAGEEKGDESGQEGRYRPPRRRAAISDCVWPAQDCWLA